MFTFAVSLVLSLVLWYPTLRATMAGTVDVTDAGIRYCLALAISWAGSYGVSALVAMYAGQPKAPSPPPEGATGHPNRRREDPAPPAPRVDQQPDAA
jgi:hypothetical protein